MLYLRTSANVVNEPPMAARTTLSILDPFIDLFRTA